MKIRCTCGGLIVDNTDYHSNKGYIISDQDYFDLLDAIDDAIENSGPSKLDKERALMKVRSMSATLTKIIYQCLDCGRLYLDGDRQLDEFVYQGSYDSTSFLASALGENWKRPLRGDWNDSRTEIAKGYVSCYGYQNIEEYKSYEQLEAYYFSLFHELVKNNTLRDAMLKRNNTVIHYWKLEEK